jgi:hypothetical protein
MIQITQLKDPPLRLILGNIALERIFAKYDTQNAEFKKYESLSRSADYEN